MESPIKKFLQAIDSFLEGGTSYGVFEARIADFYERDEIDHSLLSAEELEFLDYVYERTTYTTEGLPKSDQDRKYGLIDEKDFHAWLAEMKFKNIHLWENA